MNVWLAWILVLVPAAAILWSLATFALKLPRHVRFLICALVPAAAVAGLFFVQYWMARTPPAEPGWDIFYALASLVGGAATMIVTLPMFAVAERLFGGRAP